MIRYLRLWGIAFAAAVTACSSPPEGTDTSQNVALDPTTTPADCLQQIRDNEQRLYMESRETGEKISFAEVREKGRVEAKRCAAKFDPARLDRAHHVDLGRLYLMARELSKARNIFDVLVADQTVHQDERAAIISEIISAYGNSSNGDTAMSRIAQLEAERVIEVLDGIPGVALQKVKAHGSLMGWYQDPADEEIRQRHLDIVLDHVEELTPTEQHEATYHIYSAYQRIANRIGNQLRPDSSIVILTSLEERFPGIDPSVIDPFRERELAFYRQVGHSAPKINADYTVNGEPPTFEDQVTMVIYSAHWCQPCKVSYPGVKEIYRKYGPKGLQIAFFVTLDNSFERDMTPEEEVEANREYFVEKNGFTFTPIAFQRSAFRAQLGESEPPADQPNSEAYNIGSLPGFFIIDKEGTIRGALRGWDMAGDNQRAISDLVERLLAE